MLRVNEALQPSVPAPLLACRSPRPPFPRRRKQGGAGSRSSCLRPPRTDRPRSDRPTLRGPMAGVDQRPRRAARSSSVLKLLVESAGSKASPKVTVTLPRHRRLDFAPRAATRSRSHGGACRRDRPVAGPCRLGSASATGRWRNPGVPADLVGHGERDLAVARNRDPPPTRRDPHRMVRALAVHGHAIGAEMALQVDALDGAIVR